MSVTETLLNRAEKGTNHAPSGKPASRLSGKRGSIVLGVTLVLLAVYPFLPFISDYWIDVAFFVGIYALLGLSLNIVLGEVGLFDLGHTAFYAIGAYVTAILNTTLNIPIIVLLPISALVAAGFAYLVTSPIIHLKGDYLCIVTIGIGEIVRLTMINNPFGLTGGPNGVNGIGGPNLFGLAISSSRQFYLYTWIIIGIVVFGLTRLQHRASGGHGTTSARTKPPRRQAVSTCARTSCWPSFWVQRLRVSPATSTPRSRCPFPRRVSPSWSRPCYSASFCLAVWAPSPGPSWEPVLSSCSPRSSASSPATVSCSSGWR